MMSKKVILGLSGGVDSSVSAIKLLEAGYDVTAVFMKNWEEDDNDEFCSASEDIADAEAVCQKLKIPFKKINFASEYWDYVFEYFLKEYKAGRTPNPDILCNKEIKFKAFLDYAKVLGGDFIATGHYVRKDYHNGKYRLLKGLDPNKDQSYFLCALNQAQLEPALFPIGEIEKPKVRQIAEESGLITHNKKDSTGICFIGERKFKDFLNQYLPAKPGNIEDEFGNVIGKHDGLMYYTIGQRQGLGIGGVKNRPEAPWFSAEKDLERNVLIAVQGSNHPLLFASSLTANQFNWISGKPPKSNFNAKAKIRYRQRDQLCQVSVLDSGIVEISFTEPQRAITEGQSVVLYNDDVCLGGGVIINKQK
ncbi:tRNA 2-thiouridine(34) synthase MnmA [Thiotrichales bacterium 19S11-10]|nr:tRNA 2-thiouridine(34) synthase MnmA [Thiotrichales bacterium 19S11-10]